MTTQRLLELLTMNIDDVVTKDIVIPPAHEVFPQIFAKQVGLIHQYIDIERRNGFYKPDLNLTVALAPLDDAQFQNWLKNTFWRTTEELAEAVETIPVLLGNQWEKWDNDHGVRHFYEEIIDAVHFFVEASIYLRVPPKACGEWLITALSKVELGRIKATEANVMEAITVFIMRLGLTANCLKNKPWKSTHMATDTNDFNTKLLSSWHSLCMLLALVGLNHEKLFCLYFKKHAVNKFRQGSNY